MKAVTAFAMLLALCAPLGAFLGATAQAKVAPLESYAAVIAASDWVIASRSSASQMESDYFRAPQSPLATERIFSCRLQHVVFEKTRLAQSCR